MTEPTLIYPNLYNENGQVVLTSVPTSFDVGDVTLLPSGSDPTIVITGAPPAYTINFGIPEVPGPEAVGAVEAQEALSVAAVVTQQTTSVAAVNTAGTTQVAAVNTAGATQVAAVAAQGTTSLDAVTAAAADVEADRVAAEAAAGAANTAALYEALAGYADNASSFGATPAVGTAAVANRVTAIATAAPREGYLSRVDAWVGTVGDGTANLFVWLVRPSGNIDIIHRQTITGIVGTGAKTFTAGVEFASGLFVPSGAKIALGCATGGVLFGSVAVASSFVTPSASPINLAASVSTLAPLATAYVVDKRVVGTVIDAIDTDAERAVSAISDHDVIEKGYGGRAQATGDQGAGQDTLITSDGIPFPYSGWLTGVQYNGVVAGDIEFQIWTAAGVFVDSFTATIAASSGQTATAPTPIKIEAGWLLFRRNLGGRLASFNFTFQSAKYINADYDYTGAVIADTASTPAMRPVIRRYKTTREVIDEQLRKQTLLGREFFPGTSTPASWSLVSPWTVNTGLKASGGGGAYTKWALFDKFSNAEYKTTRIRFTLADATTKFGFCTFPQDSGSFSYGTVGLLDASAGAAAAVIALYGWNGGAALAGAGVTVSVPWTIVTGREYILEMKKVRYRNVLKLIDTVSGSTISVTGDKQTHLDTSYTDTGRQWGKMGVCYLSGDVTIKMFERFTDVQQNPHVLWFGDSNSEGGLELQDNYDRSYVSLLEKARGIGDWCSMSRGGASADEAELCFDLDLTPFSPTYAVWNLGTNPSPGANDTARNAALRVSTQNFITAALARSAVPVIVAPPPYTGESTRILLARTDVVGLYYGGYPYIDLTFPLSTALDGVTLLPLYQADSGLHFSIEGHQKIYEEIVNQAPWLVGP